MQMEYCNYSAKQFINDISKMSFPQVKIYLDIFFFQIFYTIIMTQRIFPYFTHNDLFIRNILGIKENDNNNHYTYMFDGDKYYVPAKLFFPKINDFGYSNLDENVHNLKLYKSEYKDLYNLLLDVYNGGNLGANSLSILWINESDKILQLKEYFNTFFNTDVIDSYMNKSRNDIVWSWNNILSEQFVESLEPFPLKNPSQIMKNYFYPIFSKIDSNIASFG